MKIPATLRILVLLMKTIVSILLSTLLVQLPLFWFIVIGTDSLISPYSFLFLLIVLLDFLFHLFLLWILIGFEYTDRIGQKENSTQPLSYHWKSLSNAHKILSIIILTPEVILILYAFSRTFGVPYVFFGVLLYFFILMSVLRATLYIVMKPACKGLKWHQCGLSLFIVIYFACEYAAVNLTHGFDI